MAKDFRRAEIHYHQAMKANKVPEWYIESCGKSNICSLKLAAAYVMMALRGLLQGSPSDLLLCLFLNPCQGFDIKTMGAGLMP